MNRRKLFGAIAGAAALPFVVRRKGAAATEAPSVPSVWDGCEVMTEADLVVAFGAQERVRFGGDLSSRPVRIISPDSQGCRGALDVFEGQTKLLRVYEVMCWDGLPGAIIKEGTPKVNGGGGYIEHTLRWSDQVRLVFSLEDRDPRTAQAIGDYYRLCEIAEFRMPPGV